MQQRQPLDSHDVPQANARLFKALIQQLIHDSLWIMREDVLPQAGLDGQFPGAGIAEAQGIALVHQKGLDPGREHLLPAFQVPQQDMRVAERFHFAFPAARRSSASDDSSPANSAWISSSSQRSKSSGMVSCPFRVPIWRLLPSRCTGVPAAAFSDTL